MYGLYGFFYRPQFLELLQNTVYSFTWAVARSPHPEFEDLELDLSF